MSDNSSKKAAPADDDRNLVLVDSDFTEADLDDRAWLLWERRKTLILSATAVVFAVGMGFIAWRSLRASRAEALGAEYSAATTAESRMSFAERNIGEPLAAFAALEAADAAYAKGDFADAAARYGRATFLAAAAKPGIASIAARSRIGAAVSEIRAGRADEGLRQLAGIADDPAADASLKAHALFLQAEHACGEKKFDRARAFLDRIDREASTSPGWLMPSGPKSLLIDAFPELRQAPAPAAPVAR